MQAEVYEIDKKTFLLQKDESIEYPLESLEELEDELPDNSPRFVVLSYPITLKDGRKSYPYVMVYYLPPNSSQNDRMLYAGATELFRNNANVAKMLEVSESEDFEEIPNILSS